jgi:hypothetical protein
MKRQLTKAQKKRLRNKKIGGMKAPKNGLENQVLLEKLRRVDKHKANNHLGKATHAENNRYKKWEPISDIHRSFFIWKGKFSGSPKESQIARILKEKNIRYFREVSFDLKKRFDFYIPLIDLVIEYDGSQHFEFFKEINNDIEKEAILKRHGVKYIRYNRTHDLEKQLPHDLIFHPILQ